MWDIVCVSPQGHRSVSVSCHFLLQAPQCPCSVRKRFSRDHCCRGRSKPGCRIVGSHTRWELTTWAYFQLCLHRLLMSTGCKSSHNGFLDVSRSNGGLSIVRVMKWWWLAGVSPWCSLVTVWVMKWRWLAGVSPWCSLVTVRVMKWRWLAGVSLWCSLVTVQVMPCGWENTTYTPLIHWLAVNVVLAEHNWCGHVAWGRARLVLPHTGHTVTVLESNSAAMKHESLQRWIT